jgi:alkylated DNA repair dioxygenase AlkB
MIQISENKYQNLLPKDGEVFYLPDFFTKEESKVFYNALLQNIEWQQDKIKLFGKTHDVPRLTALYGNADKPYTYSGITMKPTAWLPELLEIKKKIETVAQVDFTTVLLNLYRTGKDSMGWHSDDEKELGLNPLIVSVSFGATRIFKLQHNNNKSLRHSLELTDGSLLVMQGQTQHFWKHAIPKTSKITEPRINLTFRVIQ